MGDLIGMLIAIYLGIGVYLWTYQCTYIFKWNGIYEPESACALLAFGIPLWPAVHFVFTLWRQKEEETARRHEEEKTKSRYHNA